MRPLRRLFRTWLLKPLERTYGLSTSETWRFITADMTDCWWTRYVIISIHLEPSILFFKACLCTILSPSWSPTGPLLRNFLLGSNIYMYADIGSAFNPLNPELNLICYLLALLGAHYFLHFSRIRVKSLNFRLLMSYIYIYIYIYIWSTHSWCF